jgi:hypothetical protein
MREVADAERIRGFMNALAAEAREDTRVYFTGGATAVLLGWRDSTIDIDLKLVPEHDALLRAIPRLKESLRVNVELASPTDFIPVPPGWEDRGRFVSRVGRVTYYHFDLHAQALAKVERGHAQDLSDVREMIGRELVDPARARELFQRIEPQLYRFPAIDPVTFRRGVEAVFGD